VLPIILNPEAARIGLIGAGEAFQRRLSLLVAGGFDPKVLPVEDRLDDLSVLFVAGLDDAASQDIAGRARAKAILINVEDKPGLCDFHVPALVRRGDLVLSVSTRGRSPALARRLRQWLENEFGPEWEDHLQELGAVRDRLLAADVHGEALSQSILAIIDEKGWLR
jgi:Siroheme synthase (precorrin-2 oxidase/ferrochelatase domain)